MKHHFLRAAVVVSCVAVASPALAQSKKEADLPDTIVKKNGDKEKADITKLDAKGVNYNGVGGKAKPQIPWEDVQRIEYRDFPPDLTTAENALERRDYNKAEGAAEDSIKTCQDGKMKELFLARSQVAKARALRGLGRYADAAQMADAALQSANGGLYAKDASIEKVWALVENGSADCVGAASDAEKLADTFGDEFKYDIYILVGSYFERQKDTGKAKEKYAYCQNSTRRELQDRAKLGLARIKILENDPDGACDKFREILAAATDPDAIAGASVGLGDATLAKLDTATDKPSYLRQVLNIYLKGAVLAYPQGNGPTENHQASLRKAAEICEKIVGTLDAKDKSERALAARKFYIDYARKLYEDLTHTYPSTQDVEKIHEKVANLKQEGSALAAQEKAEEKPGEK